MPPKYEPEKPAVVTGAIGAAIVALAGAVEILRLYYNAAALVDRLHATRNGQEALNAYDLPFAPCAQYWVPSTDIPPQPASIATALGLHAWTVIALVLIAIEQFPAHGIIAEWDGWLQAFGPTRGAWYSGALQITIAFAQGGMSIGFSGNSVAYTIVRYVAFWALMANGVWNLVLGATAKWQEAVSHRTSTARTDKGSEKGHTANKKFEIAWRTFENHLKTTHADHMQNGALIRKLDKMRDAVMGYIKV